MLDWSELTKLTGYQDFFVEKVRITDTGVAIEGPFEIPKIAKLPAEDLAFISAFIHCHGSIKKMEVMFGVSYPTIKGRLNKLASALEFVEIGGAIRKDQIGDVLDQLEEGQISADQAIEEMES